MPKRLFLLLGLCAAAGLPPAASAQNTNTIVRFHFYRGATLIGDVDMEMFDQDKPVTVSNFLSYVRSGAYQNLLLNRCRPGFVIQAGGLWTPSPLSSAVFEAGLTADHGPITNEFNVGPRLSNTFGTIAMARAVGELSSPDGGTNSASSQWYFNLADNSGTLDTNYGGFTVFGRILPGTNAVQSMAVLDFFNHLSPKLNILNLGTYYTEFPVSNPLHNCRANGSSANAGCPRFNELYHIRISILPGNPADANPPTVAITSPVPNATITNGSITISGTAADDVGVSSIYYSIANRPFTNAPGGTNWSIAEEVLPGTNRIYLFSVDASGQRSAPAIRTFFYSYPEPLHLTNNGVGTVTGATNGQLFEIGRFVTLTAKPGRGYLLGDWNGLSTAPPRLSFRMFTNASATATFVTNPFAPLKGTWSGLFFNPEITNQPNGAITFSVTDQGKVSGKLNVVGRNLPFSGALTAYGEGEVRVSAASVAPLFGVGPTWTLRFVIDTTNKSDQVFGPYTDNPGYPHVRNPDSTYGFTSELRVNKVRLGTPAAPSLFTGKYTLAISGSTNSATEPGGDSHGTVTVPASGLARFVGTLADGTPFTQSAPIATNGLWPFYTGLYSGRGWMYGWVTYDFNTPADDLHGRMRWLKAGGFLNKPYANFFDFFPLLGGSRYTTATATNRVLDFTNATVTLTGPNLAAPSSNNVLLATNNSVQNLDSNKLTLTIVKPSGLFSGAVTPAGETRSIPLKGVVLPKQNYGTGFYISTNRSGRVYFGTTFNSPSLGL